MKTLFALAAGYFLGAKSGARDLDQLGQALKALCQTEEFEDVVAAARSHLGGTLKELGSMLEGPTPAAEETADLVSTVRRLVDRDR